jgi:trehalose 6-phosphate synthase
MSEYTENPSTTQDPLIVIASNRGPFSFKRNETGEFSVARGAGGLVTALGALAERHEVLWVAAALSKDDRDWTSQQGNTPQNVEGILMRLFQPDPDAYEKYYNQIANPLLWFIQHQLWDTPRFPSIDSASWDAWYHGYVTINEQFAETIAASVMDSERPILILPQDYQLYLVPRFLREKLGDRVQIQPFCHIPWPGPDAWRILPAAMREMLLIGLLDSNRVGFQTQKDAFNFVQTCRFYLPDAHSQGSRNSIHYHGRKIEAKAYPISVDVEKVEAIAEEIETKLFKTQLINQIGDNRLILRTDRVEPSKNILRSLQAFRTLLERYPEHRGKIQMVALLVPSRMEVSEYQVYLKEIMAEGGLINADFSDGFWEPVRIIVGSNYNRAIAAMQLYDVLLVNPLADGMNLVAKEGALVNQRDGVLLLSEMAGAFYELGEHALTVSPFDVHSTAETLHQALIMPAEEKSRRAEKLRERVRDANVKLWFQTQVNDALQAFDA